VSRSFLLSAIIYLLLLAGLGTLRGEIVALAIPFALYLLYGLWSAPDPLDLHIERSLSASHAAPNSDVTVIVTITNRGADIEELALTDQIPTHLKLQSDSNRHLIRIAKDEVFTFQYTVTGTRGTYIFDALNATATNLVGLTTREQLLHAPQTLSIFPDVKRLKQIPIRPRKTRTYAGLIPARVGGTGTEFFGVREYQSGDSPRMVNWKVSARHAENLYSNEYQVERAADVGIVLDARVRANLFRKDNSIFDHAVVAAASLADVFLSQGNKVGLLVYSSYLDWTFPAYGKIQREQIMQALTRAQIGESSVFAGLEHLSPRMFSPESQIVLVSPLVSDDLNVLIQLRGSGYQVMVVSPDPVKFERALLPPSPQVDTAARIIRMERDLFIRRLQRAGIQVVEWDVTIPLDHAIGPALSYTRRWL
jgi:uncharacterized protein (DUF58 family)